MSSWRAKLIERVKHGTVCVYGELEGIMGSEIPALPTRDRSHSKHRSGNTAR